MLDANSECIDSKVLSRVGRKMIPNQRRVWVPVTRTNVRYESRLASFFRSVAHSREKMETREEESHTHDLILP